MGPPSFHFRLRDIVIVILALVTVYHPDFLSNWRFHPSHSHADHFNNFLEFSPLFYTRRPQPQKSLLSPPLPAVSSSLSSLSLPPILILPPSDADAVLKLLPIRASHYQSAHLSEVASSVPVPLQSTSLMSSKRAKSGAYFLDPSSSTSSDAAVPLSPPSPLDAQVLHIELSDLGVFALSARGRLSYYALRTDQGEPTDLLEALRGAAKPKVEANLPTLILPTWTLDLSAADLFRSSFLDLSSFNGGDFEARPIDPSPFLSDIASNVYVDDADGVVLLLSGIQLSDPSDRAAGEKSSVSQVRVYKIKVAASSVSWASAPPPADVHSPTRPAPIHTPKVANEIPDFEDDDSAAAYDENSEAIPPPKPPKPPPLSTWPLYSARLLSPLAGSAAFPHSIAPARRCGGSGPGIEGGRRPGVSSAGVGLALAEVHAERVGRLSVGAVQPPASRREQPKASSPPPNAVVVHSRRGVTVFDLKTGDYKTALVIPNDGAVYTDLDRDGVLDRVSIIDSSSRAEFVASSGEDDSKDKEEVHWLLDRGRTIEGGDVPSCYAIVTSGIPPVEQIFNGSLCHDGGALNVGGDGDKRNEKTPIDIEGATPFVDEKEGNSVFFAVNSGIVTRYSASGKLLWQRDSGPTWEPVDPDDQGCSDRVGGSILSFLRGSTLLVTGPDRLVAFDKLSGSELGTMAFPQDAASAPIFCDLNGDGVDDIIVVTSDAVWGYLTRVNPSTSLLNIVIFTVLLGMLCFVFMSQKGWLAEESKLGSGSLRSTDLTSAEIARSAARFYNN